jgi:hypothetical protein
LHVAAISFFIILRHEELGFTALAMPDELAILIFTRSIILRIVAERNQVL